MKFTKWFFCIFSVLCLFYYIVVISKTGLRGSFSLFWLVCALVFGAVSVSAHFLVRLDGGEKKLILSIFWSLFSVGIAFVLILSGLILSSAYRRPPGGADYIVILGAQVRGETPSKMLRQRLEAAEIYLKENPNAVAVLSGGQGPGEDITEAEAMRRWLSDAGIGDRRLVVEDKSKNTAENIQNSFSLIGDKNLTVVIVSSEYHLFRGIKTAEKLGYNNVSGLGGKTDILTLPNYVIREVFAVTKDFLLGRV